MKSSLHPLLDMCCTLLRSSAAAGEIGAYQRASREMNPAVGGPLLAVVGGPVCGLAFGVVAAACTIAAEVSDRKK